MKNFMKEHYDHYYIQDLDGQVVEATRTECYSRGERPTLENPYKQRWLHDIEAGYIIRLARNEQGERLYRTNASAIKSEERHYARKYTCLSKGTCNCDSNCGNCLKNRTTRTVELDKPIDTNDENDGDNQHYETAASDIFAEIEEREQRREETLKLRMAIRQLEKSHQEVIVLYFYRKKTQEEIAKIIGKERSSVTRLLQTAIKKLKKLLE